MTRPSNQNHFHEWTETNNLKSPHSHKRISIMMWLATVFIGISFTGCYSVKKSVDASQPNSARIDWPEEYKPEDSRFLVHNEIEIEANPSEVWNILVQANTWENWYRGAEDLQITSGDTTQLSASSIFIWKTMGQYFESSIREFDPPLRLSWESEKKNIRGYHAWLIIPNDSGCTLITSESQHGFLAGMEKIFIPNKLRKLHDEWLLAIKNKAENKNS